MPLEPIEQFLARHGQTTPRPFSSPAVGAKPPGGEDPGIFAGFVGSLFSSVPELFGAPPSQLAEQYRSEHPVGGFVSQLGGFAIPYLGAERVAQLPSIAPRVAGAVESVLGRFGIDAETTLGKIAGGATRELIVNAPVEASRVAVGATFYPDNTDLFSDVAWSYALTGGIGGVGGLFRAGGKVLSKAGQVQGAEITMAPTHQLKMILDEGAPVTNVPKEEFIPQLTREVFSETPGVGASSKKDLPYILPLSGMNADEMAATNALFKPGRVKISEEADAPTTGLIKQTLVEGRSPNQLKQGQLESVIQMLPESVKTPEDIAKNAQFPRLITVADKDGARQLAGLTSKPGWMQISDRLGLVQERDGGFVFKYKLADGQGQAVGKGMGKAKAGEQYLIGKTLNPAWLDPKAAKLADMVTARWAKWGTQFSPGAFTDVFNKDADVMLRSLSVLDYHNMSKLSEADWKRTWKARVGRLISSDGTVGSLVDSKLGIKDSEFLSNLADRAYSVFKPTAYLQQQNPIYGRFLGLMKNAYQTADHVVDQYVKGDLKIKPGTSQWRAMLNKGIEQGKGPAGLDSYVKAVHDLTPAEVNTVMHLSGTESLSEEGLQRLIKDGVLSTKGAEAVTTMRKLNEHFIENVVMPVFKETGYDVKWLDNHLGIPHLPKGSLFYQVKDAETGAVKHLAFGKNGAEAQREAKAVIAEAKESGKNWTLDAAKPQHLAAESEDALAQLGKQIFQEIEKSPADKEIIHRAMMRLVAKQTGQAFEQRLASRSAAFKARSGTPTSFARQTYNHADMLNAVESHMKQLAHFAALQSWKERFGSVAAHMLKDKDPTLYADLIRKGNQLVGIEGKITNVLNDTLRGVLGNVAGPKPATKIATAVNSYIAKANLFWLNPTFAAVNTLTLPMTIAPWVAYMRVASEADLAKTTFMNLVPNIGRDGLPNGIAAYTDPMKFLFEAVRLMRDPGPELMGFYEQGLKDGRYHTQNFDEWLGQHSKQAQTLKGAYKEGGIPSFLSVMASMPADLSERFGRMVAANTGYLVGKEYFNLEGDALYRFMGRAVEMTQYNYSTIDRSRMFTGPVGSMFGLFKNWQMHFMGSMMQYAGLIGKGPMKPEMFAPMVWMTGSALAVGGLGATPLKSMADGLANWQDGSPNSFLWTQKHFGPDAGDAVYFGLPAFLGVSLQASAAIPGTDVRNETASLFSFAAWSRGKQLFSALGEAKQNVDVTGETGLDQRNLQDKLMGAVMPRFATKLFNAVEGDYVKSLSTGAPTVRGLGPGAKFLEIAGFNSIDVARAQVASREAYKSDEAFDALVSTYGRAYSDAYLNGDKEEQQRVIQRSIAAGVLPNVMRSAAVHNRREETGDIMSRYRKQTQSTYREVLAPQEPQP